MAREYPEFDRDQQVAAEALSDLFSKVEAPALSSRFMENLHQRIREEDRVRGRWPLRVMQVYWLAAAIISALILFRMDGVFSGGGCTMALFLLVCFIGPIVLLGRRLRFGFLDLIFSTMDLSRNRPGGRPV